MKKVRTFAPAIKMIRLQNKKFFERFYINKQNVVQASHIKLMSDEQKKNNRQ